MNHRKMFVNVVSSHGGFFNFASIYDVCLCPNLLLKNNLRPVSSTLPVCIGLIHSAYCKKTCHNISYVILVGDKLKSPRKVVGMIYGLQFLFY